MSKSNKVKNGFFKTQVDRFGQNPYIKASEEVVKLVPFKTDLSKVTVENLNLVSISLPYIESEDFDLKSNDLDYPLNHVIVKYSNSYRKNLLKQFKKALLYAVEKYKANVICINELGMPTNINGIENKNAINFAKKIANEHNCLIIAGSNHTTEGYFNVGYVFYPGLDNDGNTHRAFLKNIGAFQIGEKLFTPSERLIFHTKAFGLGFSFMICLEIADFSSSSTIVHNKENTDILIVPTYLTSYGPIAKVAKTLSEACGGVLLNNCYKSNDVPYSILYENGKLPSSRNSKMRKEVVLDDNTKIVLRRINVEDFVNRKEYKIENLSKETRFLFGVDYSRRDDVS
ncbi:hypothetical protein [uncultured Winogradskyella sp.]|uniref:hypothetical protein n=1 Tax=uncultured Winogradskyella sp. TaxID=395353 RepID=UPI002613A4B0|nr:hypothetical protein [uncultured Winogradskyella sp.]